MKSVPGKTLISYAHLIKLLKSYSNYLNLFIMKKQIITFYFLMVNVVFCFGQGISPLSQQEFKIVSQCNYIVHYKLEMIHNTAKPNDKQSDMIVLELGDDISKSYSFGLFKYDSVATVAINKGADAVAGYQKETLPNEIFKNMPSGKMTVLHRMKFQESIVFEYVENNINFIWEISNESKNIFGYNCQKATCKFRGRKWDAWFTREIPLPEGPWKFNGLPGLILKIVDEQGHYSMEITRFSACSKPIVKWDWKTEKSTREKVLALEKFIYQNPYHYLESNDSKMRLYKQTDAEARKFSFPYNPIEQE